MKSILSTKKLTLAQRGLILNAGVTVVDYDAIKIESVSVELPSKIENAIFTSQNGVNSFFENVRSSGVKNCFCVGEKTKALLEKNGQQVVKMTNYGSELADYIVNNHSSEAFHFFCGNIRREVIPSELQKAGISLTEIEVYKTRLSPKKFEREFDAVLFFSPSGVQSFMKDNSPFEGCAFICIGETTASEAKKHTKDAIVSNSTTVESVIAKAVKTINN